MYNLSRKIIKFKTQHYIAITAKFKVVQHCRVRWPRYILLVWRLGIFSTVLLLQTFGVFLFQCTFFNCDINYMFVKIIVTEYNYFINRVETNPRDSRLFLLIYLYQVFYVFKKTIVIGSVTFIIRWIFFVNLL